MASSSGRSRKDLAARRAEAQRRAASRSGGGDSDDYPDRSGADKKTTTRRKSSAAKTSKDKPKRWSRRRKILVALALILLAGLVFSWAAYARVSKDLPDLGDVNSIATFQTTKILASDNKTEIAKLAGEGNRTIVSAGYMPEHLQQAVVSIEDKRFYDHPAVDFVGILRAAWVNVVRRSVVQGGSTITQQYVKNAYFSPRRTIERKLKEVVLAYRLEKEHSKDEILALYLNTIYFGEGAYGVDAAAQTYFGRRAHQLNLAQAAMLAGLIRSPARYNPFNHPEAAKERRKVVLDLMVEEGYITQEQADAADRTPLPKEKQGSQNTGRAPYFVDHVTQRLVQLVGEQAAYSGGLTVYTTLDVDLQEAAEETVNEELDEPDDPSASVVALDPRTGAVRVMVGGRDYKSQQYNMATQGARQPGSAFKTFVLTAAVASGISPYEYFDSDSPASFEVTGAPDWKVSNYSGSGYGHISLNEATARSVNVAYANVMMEIGPDAVADTAEAMGITSPLNSDPAIALGGLKHGVNTLEMASAYGTLATGGVRAVPYTIERIKDAEGKPVPLKKAAKRRALDGGVAEITRKALEGVIDGGTGTGADIGRPQYGKTGTTQNYADAWFVGAVPQMSTSVWVGYPKEQVPMKDVHGQRVSGGSFPARIWARFMEIAMADQKEMEFPEAPDGAIEWRDIDPITGYRANPFCPYAVSAAYPKGKAPTEYCPVHDELAVPSVVGLTEAAAKEKIEDAGMKTKVAVISSSKPKGQVVAQSPAGGTKGKRGQTVTIEVSNGDGGSSDASATAVPDVVGLSLSAAKAALSKVGLNASVSYVSSSKPADQVVSSSPAAGAKVSPGGTVQLDVSGGKDGATVPSVVGVSRAAAIAKLESAGFTASVKNASKSESKGKKVGTVIKQNPAGGALGSLNSAVVIYVAVKT